MTTPRNDEKNKPVSRRRFLKATSAMLAASTAPAFETSLFAAGNQHLKVALIGCGRRGTAARPERTLASGGLVGGLAILASGADALLLLTLLMRIKKVGKVSFWLVPCSNWVY